MLGKFLIGEIIRDGVITPCENVILTLIKYLNSLLRFSEVAMLIAGTMIVISNLSRIVFEAPAPSGSVYCKKGPYMFSVVFFILVTLILAIGGVFYFAWLIHNVTYRKKPAKPKNPSPKNPRPHLSLESFLRNYETQDPMGQPMSTSSAV